MTNELGDDFSDENTIAEIILEFYPKDKRDFQVCVHEFNTLLTKKITYNLKLDLDFENKPAIYFITADIYESKSDLVALYNHLSGKKIKDCSIQFATQVRTEFLQSVKHFKEKYEWIYNPPSLGGKVKNTIGVQLRQEFQETYGPYAEITYLISNGDSLKFDSINEMRLETYLSLGEYLLRKRKVETVD